MVQSPSRPTTISHNLSEAAVPDSFLSRPSLNISYCQSGPRPTLMIGGKQHSAQGRHTHTHTQNTHNIQHQVMNHAVKHTQILNYCAVNQTGCNYLK